VVVDVELGEDVVEYEYWVIIVFVV